MTPDSRSWLVIFLKSLGGVVLLAAVFAAGFGLDRWLGHTAPLDPAAENASHGPAAEAEIWTCSMHPNIRQPKPGKCPICAMDLVPVKQSSGGLRELSVTPEAKKLMEIETTPVVRRYVTADVRMVGKVTYDETRLEYITAWVAGRLERMFVNTTGIPVRKGDHMVSIYSPDLYSAENDLIQAMRFAPATRSAGEVDFVESSREKLRRLGLKDEQIAKITKDSKPSDEITIYSPASGIVVTKNRQPGDYVQVGERIYTVSDLTHLWVMLDAYESDLIWLRYGQQVVFTTEAYPGEKFVGRISLIDRWLTDQTRTVKVRVNVENPSGKLKPEMFVRGVVHSQVAAGGLVIDPALAGKWISPMHPEIVKDQPGKCDICGMALVRAEELGYATPGGPAAEPLVIPYSAALITGTRAVVYVELPGREQPTYEGREILLGPRAGDFYLVRHGLIENERVVTRGNFKIDSALQIQAKPSMMTPEGGGGGGHHHGGPTSPGSESPAPAGEVPLSFRHQLGTLEKAAAAVHEAIGTGNEDEVRGAFEGVAAALKQVNAATLTDHARVMWNELAMLLGNDASEGSAVRELSEAKRVAGLLAEHMARVREQFGPAHGGHEGLLVREPIPAGFQKQIGGLWTVYGDVQAGLAADDEKRARDAAARYQTVLARIDPAQLTPPLLDVWNKEKPQLEMVLKSFLGAKDIAALREQFAPLSGSTAAIVTRFGTGTADHLYRIRCSMANGNRGATWLQKDDKPLNPYMGQRMPRCADGSEVIPLPLATVPKKMGHDHE
jgi:Cu(I)/Ag(I) efflux system membrane fusion protein